jgi:hypothetical protein
VPEIVHIEKILLTPLGEAEADLMWVSDSIDTMSEFHCWIFETNESWWFPQSLVRAVKSMSAPRRGQSSEIVLSEAHLRAYASHILRHKKSLFYNRAKTALKKGK